MSHPCDDDDCRDYWEFVQTVMAEQYAETFKNVTTMPDHIRERLAQIRRQS